MERKLASIQTIKNIKPIKDADNIELATILGWGVVVKKGMFKIGDMVIFVEIDSVMPEDIFDKPEYNFLKTKKFHIKAARIQGKISQGIVFPLSIFEKYGYSTLPDDDKKIIKFYSGTPSSRSPASSIPISAFPDGHWRVLKNGVDVTDIMRIKQYEFPIPKSC